MGASVNRLMLKDGPRVVFTKGYRQMIEDHLEHIRQHETTETIDIQNQRAYRNHGDFYGLLKEYEIPNSMWWVIMRINGMLSPDEFTHDMEVILAPSMDYLNRLRRVYRNTEKNGS